MNKIFLKKVVNVLFLLAWVIIIGTIIYNCYFVYMNWTLINEYHRLAILGDIMAENLVGTFDIIKDNFLRDFHIIQVLNIFAILFIILKIVSWRYSMKNSNNITTTPRNETYDDIVIGLFSFKGRMGGLEYGKVILSTFLGLSIYTYTNFISLTTNELIKYLVIMLLLTLALVPMTLRRLHDSNHSGEYLLIPVFSFFLTACANSIKYIFSHFFDSTPPICDALTYISFAFTIYFLYLISRPSDLYANNYGQPNPLKNYGNKTINGICIFIFIFTFVSGIISLYQ